MILFTTMYDIIFKNRFCEEIYTVTCTFSQWHHIETTILFSNMENVSFPYQNQDVMDDILEYFHTQKLISLIVLNYLSDTAKYFELSREIL